MVRSNFHQLWDAARLPNQFGEEFDFGTRDDGTSTFDPLYIRDMTHGYLLVAENLDRVSGEAFNFASGNPVSCWDLVKLVSQ